MEKALRRSFCRTFSTVFFSTRKGGAGIGLSLAKEIVSLHKGTISASNDGGAVFEIGLPLR